MYNVYCLADIAPLDVDALTLWHISVPTTNAPDHDLTLAVAEVLNIYVDTACDKSRANTASIST